MCSSIENYQFYWFCVKISYLLLPDTMDLYSLALVKGAVKNHFQASPCWVRCKILLYKALEPST